MKLLFRTIILCFVLLHTTSFAQKGSLAKETNNGEVTSGFATKGMWELGGGLGYSSSESVSTFSVAPTFGYFVTNGLELGCNPLQYSHTSFNGGDFDLLNFNFFTAYNLNTGGKIYPFIEASIGYGSMKSSNINIRQTSSGANYGGRLGLKLLLAENAVLNFALAHNSYGYSNSNSDNTSFNIGFTVCFK